MAHVAFSRLPEPEYFFTNHARSRMSSRSVSSDAIDMVIACGRQVHIRGAVIHVIGHREAYRLSKQGVCLNRCEGLHVVCAQDGAIITVYRNHDLSGLRGKGRRTWH